MLTDMLISEPDEPRIPIGTDLGLLLDAVRYAVKVKRLGPAAIQRHVRVGWLKASRLALLLRQEGITGEPDAKGWYPVLAGPDGLDAASERIRKTAEEESQCHG